MKVSLGKKQIGHNQKVYLIGEIGINHNGSIKNALKLIRIAKDSGFDAVKFQKRTPEVCVPEEQKNVIRDTPWGKMTYIEYKHKIEFNEQEYSQIDSFCKEIGIDWFASVWDKNSVDFIENFNPICYKIASASITDHKLINHIKSKSRPIILSTGMSTLDQIDSAVNTLKNRELLIAHSTSAYPCNYEELNLNMIKTLKERFKGIPIGYSGHEKGISTSVSAVAIGACHIERHITLNRTMWGTDHAASLEKRGMELLCRDIRNLELALGDGVKKVYDSEKPIIEKLRIKN
ncbi:MAG: N-acetylneuraminate synthase family protein [Flavobacteriales bacterium]|nr:N-acetylneuraminate synthase family protein [Flavobacteriales bacterium]